MAEEKEKKVKVLNFRDMSICETTIQMLEKAAKDGVDTAFTRAAEMSRLGRAVIHIPLGRPDMIQIIRRQRLKDHLHTERLVPNL